jgi:hypothetical protein
LRPSTRCAREVQLLKVVNFNDMLPAGRRDGFE